MKQETIKIGNKNYPCWIIQTIVVGSGAAGLNAAVSLWKNGQTDLAVVTEGKIAGTSRNAGSDKQTYYKISTSGSEPDSVRELAQTLFKGESMDGDIALAEAASSAKAFYHLVDIGVPFPHNSSGEFIGYKTDHDPRTRGTSAGPFTSKYMTENLQKQAELRNIPIFDGYQVIEILVDNENGEPRTRGILALNTKRMGTDEQYTVFLTDNVIYATGGEANMYDTSVYPVSQTGGSGAAFRAGVRGKNLTESQYGIASIKFRWNLSGTYQQVIPRYVSTDQDGNDEKEFLDQYFENCTDLLNAIFLKGYQWPFDPRKVPNFGSSLIDILVYNETVIKGRRVFLDYLKNPSCSEKDGKFDFSKLGNEARQYLENSHAFQDTPIERLAHMNPKAIELYSSRRIDLYSEKLEIAVCAQHNNGGLAGNAWWESNVKHFFPVGEANGAHGVYRPGGSALNSGQVGGLRAAQFIAKRYKDLPLQPEELIERCGEQLEKAIEFGASAFSEDCEELDMGKERKELQERMSKYGAHIRSAEGARLALEQVEQQMERIENGGVRTPQKLRHLYRLRDLLTSQKMYLSAILDYIKREGKSRGSYLIFDKNGQKPSEMLPDQFRFRLESGALGKLVQEIAYDNGECNVIWREVRPIPEDDSWFENVWKDYLNDAFYK
jgi:succinate dehydrogenase/fumarate reductase flavoprotein subunit